MDPVAARVAELLAQRGRGASTELARAVGVTQSAASRWAQGKSRPDPRYWPAIEKFFELEPGSLGIAGVDITSRVAALEAQLQELRGELASQQRALRKLVRSIQHDPVES